MLQGSTGISLDIVIYIVSLAAMWGSTMFRVKELEKKMDRLNDLVERVSIAERDVKTAFRLIDDMKEAIK